MLAKTDLQIPPPVSSKVDDDPITLTKQQILEIARVLDSTVERNDLAKARTAWTRYQSSRKRNAVYGYLSAVLETVHSLKNQHGALARLRRKLIANKPVDVIRSQDPFAVIICCTSDARKMDAKTRSKWSRAFRYAERFKPDTQAFTQFVKSKGGINECAARWSAKVASCRPKNHSVA
jgi:hypothetical protein